MELKSSGFYFDRADRLSKCISYSTLIISCLSICGIFLNGFWLYVIATITLLMQLFTWVAMYYRSDFSAKAISIKRLEMLRGVIGGENYYRERLYIDEDAEIDNGIHADKLTPLIQENAYWNSILYIKAFQHKLKSIFVTMLLLALCIIFMYAALTDGLDFQFSRAIFGILVINNLYTLFSDAFGFFRAHAEMKKIDSFIEINNQDASRFLPYIYSKYEHEIFVAPSINGNIYSKYSSKIKKSWAVRVCNKKSFQSKRMFDALIELSSLFQSITEEWYITGGANRYLRGVQIYANDIDVITTEKGANEICKLMNPGSTGVLYKTTSENIKSFYFTFVLKGVRIEIMGDPENKSELGWVENKKWQENKGSILLDGNEIPCMSLAYEIEINKEIGNINAFNDSGYYE